MPNLYKINMQILECVDEETGEIIDFEKFEKLNLQRENKLENLALWYKNLLSDMTAYEAEEKKFKDWKTKAKLKSEQIKAKLDEYLCGQKFMTDKIRISYRKSEVTDIEDVYKLPEDYITYKPPEPKKAEIKQAIKNGEIVPGAKLIEKQNIVIK